MGGAESRGTKAVEEIVSDGIRGLTESVGGYCKRSKEEKKQRLQQKIGDRKEKRMNRRLES